MDGEKIKEVMCSCNRGYLARLQAMEEAGGKHFEHRLKRVRTEKKLLEAVAGSDASDMADEERAEDEHNDDEDLFGPDSEIDLAFV